MRFPHNDALIVMIHIRYCKVLKILVGERSSVNILYVYAQDRMEDTP